MPERSNLFESHWSNQWLTQNRVNKLVVMNEEVFMKLFRGMIIEPRLQSVTKAASSVIPESSSHSLITTGFLGTTTTLSTLSRHS